MTGNKVTHTETEEKSSIQIHRTESGKKSTLQIQQTIKFHIEEFEALMNSYKSSEYFWSEGVPSELTPHAVWWLKVYPNGDFEQSKGHTIVFLHLTGPMTYPLQHDHGETLDTTYNIYLVDGSEGSKLDVLGRRTENFGEGGYGSGRDASHDQVKKALQVDGSLVLAADVEFLIPYEGGKEEEIFEASAPSGDEKDLFTKWLDSVDKLRESGAHSDCTLTIGDGTDVDELVPAHYSLPNWPKGLRIDELYILLEQNLAVAQINGAMLEPFIPLDQLARFLNEHVQGDVGELSFKGGEGLEDMVPRLLDEVTVPGRLHAKNLYFLDFFHLSWAGIKRILDGRTLRANTIEFNHLQLPSGVDANELLKLPTVRECPILYVDLSLSAPQLPGPPPLFHNAALMEWLEQGDDRARLLLLASDYLSDGHLSFLDALKENFQQATQVHCYSVRIDYPSINGVTGGQGVRDEELSNRLGEKMLIRVRHPFEALQVWRALPI